MTSNAIKFAAVGALVAMAAGTFSSLSQAQPVYRIVGPDGKVTYSDKPPPATGNAKVTAGSADGARGVVTASLPFELRKVVGQYPVTLYSGENCGPCASARSLLTTRGVPFAEKTIATNEDAQALQRISGDNSLPFLTIGSQQLKGFSDAEWTQFLDAAGYPKSSVLPASYRQAPATPLVTVAPTPAPATTTAARPATPAAPSTPVTPPPSNPAGIRF
ncbi:MAG: glutaredoxin domain-containing protein [Polaromonas sp.]|uniref:glutaredoxin domain-containing protein n=1 Tax=Polaromonas sp. TaxID=1869339 RepID=UPI002725E053|nr:glutaredoxin domain-containing protein [Polaromonas sp.]MDO9116166.1 glutaredoxin domain-containing protein [Polaromonas sp.]MDP1887605.1 glutaredoxin domain-containing protein [Polaromonas sp.]